MKNLLTLVILIISLTGFKANSQGQQTISTADSQKLGIQVVGNDTIYLAFLKEVHIFPPNKFKNRKQEEFYWRTVRDVKKALPYARIVSKEMNAVNGLLVSMKKDSDRKKYLTKYEKAIFKKYEADLRKFTVNQGRMLLKLIDRECNSTSYDLIKSYRGSVSAFFWQGIARFFGTNLKSEYDASGNDRIVERVIILVESGQL